MAEPSIAVGAGAGYRFTGRSDLFTEVSYIGTSPIYRNLNYDLKGFRLLAQYRYHFVHPWSSVKASWIQSQRKEKWIAAEFRLRNYTFLSTDNFTNKRTADTLQNFRYTARASVIGGAILFGSTFKLGSSGRWLLETSVGIGAKQKLVRLKNVPTDYERVIFERKEWAFVPAIYEPLVHHIFPLPYVCGTN